MNVGINMKEDMASGVHAHLNGLTVIDVNDRILVVVVQVIDILAYILVVNPVL
jgi:hypothetical protein